MNEPRSNARRNSRRRQPTRPGPWGTACGLVTASAVTLVGTCVGLDPHIILWRALASGLLIAALVSFGLSVVHLANTTPQDNRK